MTTIPSVAQRLIEAALAWRDIDTNTNTFGLIDAVDDYLDLDPTGSELARLAEIGAAVERLPEWGKVMRVGNAWVARVGDDLSYSATNIPAVIAAALGDAP